MVDEKETTLEPVFSGETGQTTCKGAKGQSKEDLVFQRWSAASLQFGSSARAHPGSSSCHN